MTENPDSKAASLNLPGYSALGVEGTSGHTFPESPPPPLADSPLLCYILSEGLDPSRKNGRSHTSLLLTGVKSGSPPSTFLRREIDTYIAMKQQTLENSTWKKNEYNTYNVILPCGTQSLKRIRASFKRSCESVL